MSEVVKEKTLSDGKVLRIIQIPEEDTDDNPNNDYRLMLYLDSKTRVGAKYASEVCHLLSRDSILSIFDDVDTGIEFVDQERTMIDRTLTVEPSNFLN